MYTYNAKNTEVFSLKKHRNQCKAFHFLGLMCLLAAILNTVCIQLCTETCLYSRSGSAGYRHCGKWSCLVLQEQCSHSNLLFYAQSTFAVISGRARRTQLLNKVNWHHVPYLSTGLLHNLCVERHQVWILSVVCRAECMTFPLVFYAQSTFAVIPGQARMLSE